MLAVTRRLQKHAEIDDSDDSDDSRTETSPLEQPLLKKKEEIIVFLLVHKIGHVHKGEPSVEILHALATSPHNTYYIFAPFSIYKCIWFELICLFFGF